MFGYLHNLTRDMEETRDLLQELFVRLAKKPPELDKIKDPRAFLFRMSHNIWVDLIRRRETGRRITDKVCQPELSKTEETAPPADHDEQHVRQGIDDAIADLPPDQRAVVHLKLRDDQTFTQIATILDIPANTAASRYRYGLDKIRELLRPLYQELNE